MTDKYGTEGEHELAAQDMSEAETWNDSEPPVDDFADQPHEETATVSEESEMVEDHHDVDSVSVKKKSMMLPAVAGVGGLLLLGAVLYWQFGTSSSGPALPPPPPLTTANSNAPSAPGEAAGANSDKAPAEAVAPTTSLVPADTKTASAMPSSGVAVPVPATPSVPSAPPATLSAETLAKAPPAPVVAAPVATPVPASAPIVAVVTPPAAPASAAKDASIDARLAALTTHVEAMQKALAETTKQLAQVSNMVAATATAGPGGSGTPSSAMEERMNRLEQQVMQMQHARPVTAASPVVTQETPTEVVADATPEKPVMPTSTSSSYHHKPSVKHSAVYRSHRTKTAHVKTKATTAHWVLRAATPDEAWVSDGESTEQLRHVQVGDTLAGVGRIKAIRQHGDDWVVEGSKGLIH